jgi:hypothetical protein
MNPEYYFIYKLLDNNRYGKFMPPQSKLGIDSELGLAVNEPWYLGKCNDIRYLDEILEFDPYLITTDVALGFGLLNVNYVPDIDATSYSYNANIKLRPLNEQELYYKTCAKQLFDKYELRYNITTKIGDTNDLLADINRKVSLLERIVFQYILDPNSNEMVNTYIPLMQDYFYKLITGVYKDSIDFEDHTELFHKLKLRDTEFVNVMIEAMYKQMENNNG